MANVDPMTLLFLGNEIQPFDGKETTNAREWLEHFTETTHTLPVRQKLRLFCKKMTKNAEFWFRGLANANKATWVGLIRVFTSKYIDPQISLFNEQILDTRKMRKDENIDDFILEVRKLCRTLNKPQEEVISHVILNSLPHIRKFLTQKYHAIHNIDDLEKYSRIAEQLDVQDSAAALAGIQERFEPLVKRMEAVAALNNDTVPIMDDENEGRSHVIENTRHCFTCDSSFHIARYCHLSRGNGEDNGRSIWQDDWDKQYYECHNLQSPSISQNNQGNFENNDN